MHEILDHLPAGALVLDLGSQAGSFSGEGRGFLAVRVDINRPGSRSGCFVQADAASLPFKSRAFDAAVLNNSLEHFVKMGRSLQEVGRVLKPGGAAFISVPDACTLSDRIYRKVYRRAGGHVNLFTIPDELGKTIAWYLNLPHVGTRTLLASFVYLNRKHVKDRGQRRAGFSGFGDTLLAAGTAATRLLDRCFGTRASVYGWAMYFGSIGETVDERPWSNVCVHCGQGHDALWLEAAGLVRRFLVRYYRCPGCSAFNFYFRDDWRPEEIAALRERRRN